MTAGRLKQSWQAALQTVAVPEKLGLHHCDSVQPDERRYLAESLLESLPPDQMTLLAVLMLTALLTQQAGSQKQPDQAHLRSPCPKADPR